MAKKDVTPHRDKPIADAVEQHRHADFIPDLDYTPIREGRSFLGDESSGTPSKVTDWLIENAIMPALEKLVPQGAAELSQAIFTGNSYVPYGPTERPVSMPDAQDGHGVHGPAQEQGVTDLGVGEPMPNMSWDASQYAAPAMIEDHSQDHSISR